MITIELKRGKINFNSAALANNKKKTINLHRRPRRPTRTPHEALPLPQPRNHSQSLLMVVPAELMIIKKPIIQGPGHGRIESPSTIRLSIKSKYKGL